MTGENHVRAAFNSPFWPFVLASTSVGQEGLDFHPYCHAVVHWNLPGNPVDMEQREGRVHRYKGHAVRKNVANAFAARGRPLAAADRWRSMFQTAQEQSAGKGRGLVPDWTYPSEAGARIERHVPILPSAATASATSACASPCAYRMVLGQARQEDLVAYLLEHMDGESIEDLARELRVDLRP